MKKEEYIQFVSELASVMKENGIDHINIKEEDFEIELSKSCSLPPIPPMPPMGMAPMAAPAAAPAEASAPAAPAALAKSITSPIVGTFYAAPAPTKPAFVKAGDKVNVGDVVCIVESMKVMNEIVADKAGTVTAIAVNDGEAVEFGQPLIILD